MRVSIEQLQAIIKLHAETATRKDADRMIELTDDGTYGLPFRFRQGKQGGDLWENYKSARVEPGGTLVSVKTINL